MPTSPESITAAFTDDTAALAMGSGLAIASHKLQTNLLAIGNWFKKWRMKANGSKSSHITFNTRKETCPPGSYKQYATLPRRRCEISRTTA
jgi:hypothetical protein